MSGSSRMPKELTLGPQEYRRIQETSRWQVELDMIMANCEELDPEMKKTFDSNKNNYDDFVFFANDQKRSSIGFGDVIGASDKPIPPELISVSFDGGKTYQIHKKLGIRWFLFRKHTQLHNFQSQTFNAKSDSQ